MQSKSRSIAPVIGKSVTEAADGRRFYPDVGDLCTDGLDDM